MRIAISVHYRTGFKIGHAEAAECDLSSNDSVELDKSNVLLIGPTGSGMTIVFGTIEKRTEGARCGPLGLLFPLHFPW